MQLKEDASLDCKYRGSCFQETKSAWSFENGLGGYFDIGTGINKDSSRRIDPVL